MNFFFFIHIFGRHMVFGRCTGLKILSIVSEALAF